MDRPITKTTFLPPNVRYDQTLNGNAKVLFSEIAGTLDSYGCCTKTNGYFANTFGFNKGTISKWINDLKKAGYIEVWFETDRNNHSIRMITIKEDK